jgi:spore germination protein
MERVSNLFIVAITSNYALLRRRIRNPKLKFKTISMGKITNQTAAIAYIEDLVKPNAVDLVYEKLKSIDYDAFFDVGFLAQALADNNFTPFPHYLATERPDKTVSSLLEGKLAVLLEGSPAALIMPISFFSSFQAPDDYNTNWLVGSLNRLIRMTALLIALFLPSLYIAIVSFHYYMIPLNLLVPLAESRAKVPFPPIIEVLILEFTVEMLREATVRLPTYIGTAIGIVGGLIIGQAAVQAGIVSNLIIIIVAITALASYLIPNFDMGLAIRYCRFIVMFFAAIFGIIGVAICALFLMAHLITLESLGEPYFKPLFPFNPVDIKDTWLRPSLKALKKRPTVVNDENEIRGKDNAK